VALVAFFLGYNQAPAPEDVIGTIGGVEKAEKHRTQQIAEGDVVLDAPEKYAALQNDKFLRLINDESFRKAIENGDFRHYLQMENAWWTIWRGGWFRQAHESADFKHLMANSAFRSSFSDDRTLRAALAGDAMRDVMAQPDAWRAFQADGRVAKQVPANLRTLLETDEGFRKAFFSESNRELFASDDFSRLLQMDDQWWFVWRGGWFRHVSETADFQRLMENVDFRKWLAEDPEFRSTLTGDAMRDVMSQPDAWRAFQADARVAKQIPANMRTILESDDGFRKAFFSETAKTFFTSEDFSRMLQMEDQWWLYWHGGWRREAGADAGIAGDDLRRLTNVEDQWLSTTWLVWRGGWHRQLSESGAITSDDLRRLTNTEDEWWLYWHGGW